jgi:flavin reductase (DIM6/NTAB) family NADH-FMN oxidoreductase RutF
MTVTQEQYRQAWGKFATGVSVITTVREDGGVHRMTANALCSVSLDPPLLVLCVGHQRNTYQHLKSSGRFGINFLPEGESEAATRYARSGDEGGDTDGLHCTASGTVAMDAALVFMDCRVVSEHVAGDHSIFVAEVDGIEARQGAPLLFYEGRYASLAER